MRLRWVHLAALAFPALAPGGAHAVSLDDPIDLVAEIAKGGTAATGGEPASGGAKPGATKPDETAVTGSIGRAAADNTRAPAAAVVDPGSAGPRTADENPFAPLGIRVGSFVWYPTVTLSGGYTTNAAGAAGGSGAAFGTISPELLIRSDWSRHEATLTLRGSYQEFSDGSGGDPTAGAEATARFDFAERWNSGVAVYFDYATESASDPNSPQNVDREPGYYTYGGTTSLNGAFGRHLFTVTGFLDRATYDDAVSGGVTIDQHDRNNTVYGGRVRLGYEVTPGFVPFIEGELSRRDYDEAVDDDGIARSSRGEAIRFGVAFDRSPVSSGEIAVGYQRAVFDDPALATLSALTVDGSLVWSPTALTTVTSGVFTTLNPSTNPSSSGSVVHGATVELAYAYRENILINLSGSATNEKYQGIDRNDWTYTLGTAATWRLKRGVDLVASYTHEWKDASSPGYDYTADTVRLDLRVSK